jgi:hypothetical protein
MIVRKYLASQGTIYNVWALNGHSSQLSVYFQGVSRSVDTICGSIVNVIGRVHVDHLKRKEKHQISCKCFHPNAKPQNLE